MKRLLVLLATVLLLLLLTAPAASAMTVEQAVDKLVKQGWPQKIERHLISFRDGPLGFRTGGSPADDAQARYIAKVMRQVGLTDVRLEPVPADEWVFKGASVKVGNKTMTASSFAGCVGTPARGLSGEIVYVGGGSAADFDAAGDVRGKIVLIDFWSDYWWMTYPAMEAGLRGAKAIILTYSPDHPGYYGQRSALGTFDVQGELSSPPMVYLSWRDGSWLKDQLLKGTVTATVKSRVTYRLSSAGGVGYNVVGNIRGSLRNDQMIVFSSHHDAYFDGALDNASAVVTNLTIAKAMKMAGYRPKRTMVFFSTTSEEWGYFNSYYDWCIGAWYAITHTHPDWAGKVVAMLNSEIQGYKTGNLWMLASAELTPWIQQRITDNQSITTWQGRPATVTASPWSWNDQWTWNAAGVPTISFWSQDAAYAGVYKNRLYHTQFDTIDLINWRFFANLNKFQAKLAKELDRGLLPYDLKARADDMRATLSKDTLLAAGADAATVNALMAALDQFDAAASAYMNHRDLIPAGNYPAVNAQLLEIARRLNDDLSALDWLENNIYPHQQVLADTQSMQATIAELGKATPDPATAVGTISGIGLNWYGVSFSHPVYVKDLQRHRQSYYRIAWGGQGQLERYQDLTPEVALIQAGNYAAAQTSLIAKAQTLVADLDERLADMAELLDELTPSVEDLLPPYLR